MKLIDAWMKHRTLVRLGDLVEGMYRLGQVEGLETLLSMIPNRSMDPSSRKNILITIRKVARYREAARFLYRTAKKIPLVRQIKVVLVSLPENVFQRPLGGQFTPNLLSTISQISTPHGKRWNLGQLCGLLNVSEAEASNRFVEQTQRTLRKGKIHAEIQLLFHYELKGSKLPPRVICSTKDACFLCNAFIGMHGKTHTPGSHGKLYPGWRLPVSPKFQEMELRFNAELENHIRNCISTSLSRQRVASYPHPNESTLLTLPISASTLHGLVVSDTVLKEEGQPSHVQMQNISQIERLPVILPSQKPVSESSEIIPRASSLVRTGDVLNEESNGNTSQVIPSTLSSSQGLSSDCAPVNEYTLLRGQTLFKSLKVDHKTPLFTAGHLEVQIEYSPTRTTSDSHPHKLSYGIEWLTVDEAKTAMEGHASSVFSAESLEGEISHSVDDTNCFYITARGSILKISLRPSDPGL